MQAQQVLPKPPDLTWEEAASYGLCLFTAYRMLIHRAELRPGEDVLISGGSGGLGVFAVQLAAMIGEADLLAKRKTGGGQINTLRAYQAVVTAEAFQSMARVSKPGMCSCSESNSDPSPR